MENTTQQKMDSLYGKVYPFYLENNRLSNYLAYQVVSPGVDYLVRPYLSLKLVSENLPFNSKKDKIPTVQELMTYKFDDLKIFKYCIKDNESAEGVDLDSSVTSATENFTNLTKSKVFKPFMRRFRSIIQQKWSDAPSKVAELERFLRDKNIEVDVIGTSETDIEVWLDTIENCR
jgi:hypothetical protein